jgi:hypothetical protein|tara:strand:+ start:738 stop:1070 length:333 start_codon:yes stop_codon:yes gene_type:complete
MDSTVQEQIRMNNGVATIHHVIHILSKGKTGEVTNDQLVWQDDGDPPTEEQINTAIEQMQTEYDAQEYARKREAEYPSIAELTIALYDDADKEALVAKRNAVKLKYPKPS